MGPYFPLGRRHPPQSRHKDAPTPPGCPPGHTLRPRRLGGASPAPFAPRPRSVDSEVLRNLFFNGIRHRPWDGMGMSGESPEAPGKRFSGSDRGGFQKKCEKGAPGTVLCSEGEKPSLDQNLDHRKNGAACGSVFRTGASDNLEEAVVKTDSNSWRPFRKSAAAGLSLLLVLAGWPPTAAAKIKPDWSRVQAVVAGTRSTVWLYKDQASPGKRKIKGRFHSATAESVTLTLGRGQTRTLSKQALLKVLVDRPPYEGLITAGASTAIFLALAPGWDLNGRGVALFGGLFVGLPTAIAFLVAPKMRAIYHVPSKLRDDPTPAPPPKSAKQSSSAKASGVREESKGRTGSRSGDSFLEKASGPEFLRWKARQALMRKGLPLYFPDLYVRDLSAETTGMRTAIDEGLPRADELLRRAGLD